MTTPTPDTNKQNACIIVTTFTYTDDAVMLAVKNGISELLKDIPESKTEVRLVEAKVEPHGDSG